MKQFLKNNRFLHGWLLGAAGITLAYHALRYIRPLMNFWSNSVLRPLKGAIASVTHLVPFSVAEFFILAIILLALCLFIREIRRAKQYRPARGQAPQNPWLLCAYRTVAGAFAILLSLYAGFSLMYGVLFHTDTFAEQAGIHAQGGTVAELEEVTRFFAQGLNATAPYVQRDENDVFSVPIQQIFNESVYAMGPFEERFPFMEHRDHRPKPLITSRFMAMTDYVGFYFPFTAEANINILMPRSQVPATVLHEFAHQRRVALEDEANFIAIVAGIYSENPIFAYSGFLMGYSYLANALNRVAPDAFRAIHDTLNAYVLADLADIRAYHARKNPVAQRVTNVVYDGFLRAHGETDGIQSYGEVVDLLLAYFS